MSDVQELDDKATVNQQLTVQNYLKTIAALEKQAKEESRKK